MPENRFWHLLSKKLSGEATAEELRELEQLLIKHPDQVYPAEQMEKLWSQKTALRDDYDAEIAFEHHLEKLKTAGIFLTELETPVETLGPAPSENKGFRKKVLFSITAAFAVVSTFFIWQTADSGSAPESTAHKNLSEISTKPGSKTRLVLRDSTVVWLNAGSQLTYDQQFGVSNRNVSLSGEAYFDVRKNKTPFIIQAGALKIKVLGTVFNVKSYPNEKTTETSLIEGRVEITHDKRPDLKFTLKPNEKLIVANNPDEVKEEAQLQREPKVMLGAITFTNDHTIIETSWVENKLVFQDESFADLARRMERWYGVAISFSDEKLLHERLSGTITTETVQQALEALQMTTDFQFIIKSNQITISKH